MDASTGVALGFTGFIIGLIIMGQLMNMDIKELQTKAVELQCGERLSDGSFKWKDK